VKSGADTLTRWLRPTPPAIKPEPVPFVPPVPRKLPTLPNGQLRPENWSLEEDAILRAHPKWNAVDLAKKIGRSPDAVRRRRDRINQAFNAKSALAEIRRRAPDFDEKIPPRDPRRGSYFHLLDLKLAGHSPRKTELDIPTDGSKPFVTITPLNISVTGSPAASCADG
jgi:hypothetical protein